MGLSPLERTACVQILRRASPRQALGETRVDLQHLLEDIRDAYPGALEESIVTEIVANSLDSGAAALHFRTDPSLATLTVVDDGSGMSRRLSLIHI